MAGLGVQVLSGFLLWLPFTTRFARLSRGQHGLFLAILGLAAVALAISAAVLLVTSFAPSDWPPR